MTEYRKSLLWCILFCLFLAVLTAYDIGSSYFQTMKEARSRVLNDSFLIGEWIKGEFKSSDYVLRDIISEVPVSDLRYPSPDSDRQKEITSFIKSKLETLPQSITGVGLVNKDCISTHTYNVPPRQSIIGFDGSSREWCQKPMNNPNLEAFLTHSYLANTNIVLVNQLRRFIGTSPGQFYGLAGFSIELDFFAKWLGQIEIGEHGIIAIADTRMNLLARKPASPELLGKKVNDEIIEAFISSDDRSKSFSNRSPIDGETRLFGVHKVDDLPLVVVVGEADQDWQKVWRNRSWGLLGALVLLWSMSLIILRNYKLRLHERDQLKKAFEEIRTLKGILPCCSFCKKIRDDKGIWSQIDVYIQENSDADISHGICPECAKKHYPDMNLYDD